MKRNTDKQVARLRQLADGLDKQIAYIKRARRSDWNRRSTPKRDRQALGRWEKQSQLEKVQDILRKLADALERGELLDSPLANIKTKAQVESLMGGAKSPFWTGKFRDWDGHPERLATLGIDESNFQQWHEKLMSLSSKR